ncbi:unnamed protein product [Blepharisma stoltei]|uniref:6-pyruvoyltetrahydropterin synthase n=1 Tax=Blepharisma stoltei TaxID=1481888 RepID=A0AAU9KCU5_9CILI|nr:unnamed protein product [Blepharisma stoltei]
MIIGEVYSNTFSFQEATFSSSHYISDCELLHGHEYHLSISLEWCGPCNFLPINKDYIRTLLLEICSSFDKKIMIPEHSKEFPFEDLDGHFRVNFRSIHFEFPKRNCIVLPISNTTCEELSKYINSLILEKLSLGFKCSISIQNLKVSLSELYQQQEGSTNVCFGGSN